jgi:hypothetical protein
MVNPATNFNRKPDDVLASNPPPNLATRDQSNEEWVNPLLDTLDNS